MSSLGELVTGIAHEINNPVNFIYGNLTHVDGYFKNLLGAIALYQSLGTSFSPAQEEELAALELDFITEDLPKLLTSMQVGADRIRQIVLGLRNFARTDESQRQAINIHDGLDSTLMLLQSRIKAGPKRGAIAITKDYGSLPPCPVYAGPLNQVWMNLLSNAIDALDDWALTNPQADLIIVIRTEATSQGIKVAILDNGPGIPPEIANEIFNPFFTTKPVNRGTGLGLSISRQIIQDLHGGSLTCQFPAPHGTEFVIHLPES